MACFFVTFREAILISLEKFEMSTDTFWCSINLTQAHYWWSLITERLIKKMRIVGRYLFFYWMISWWWGWLGLKSPHSAAEFSSPSHSKGRGSFLILFWLHFQFAAASGWSFHGERVQGIGINRNLNFRLLRLFRSCKLCFPEYENQRRILTLPALVDA